jgi:paraquat-inducible protein B
MIVSIDTNILMKDYWLTGKEFSIFQDLIKDSDFKIILSWVTLDEVIQNYLSDISEMNKKLKEYNRLLNSGIYKMADKESIEKYEKYLKGKLHGLNKELTAFVYPTLENYQNAYERALKKIPPVKPNGAGFKDALIWETLKCAWNTYYHDDMTIHFITNDKDFSKELINELKADIYPEIDFRLYNSLNEFNIHISKNYKSFKDKIATLTQFELQSILDDKSNVQFIENKLKQEYDNKLESYKILCSEVHNVYRIYTENYFNIEIKGKIRTKLFDQTIEKDFIASVAFDYDKQNEMYSFDFL